jgi:uncharacterized membrane protein
MNSNLLQNWSIHQSWLRSVIALVLVLGLFFRFVNIDRKFYWIDETLTSLTIAGFSAEEIRQPLNDGHIFGVAELQKYVHLNPEKSLVDSLKTLTIDYPEHPPLYYLTLRLWAQLFGDSVATIRSFSVFISLLAFPCIYWLCMELFQSPLTAWMSMALIAVSPFHVLYAQEAREYSLWIVTILLSSAALLRALRVPTKLSWIIYAVTVSLALYTYPFSLYVFIGQGIYVVVNERFQLNQKVIGYLLGFIAGIISFTPWIFVIITKYPEIKERMSWLKAGKSVLYLAQRWIVNFTQVFLDVVSYSNASAKDILPLIPFILMLLALAAYSLYFLYRQTTRKVWLFVFTLMGVPALVPLLQDLASRSYQSGIARYQTPLYIGIQLAVAYLFATKISSISNNMRIQQLWRLALVSLLSAGILSCAISSQAEIWWNKSTASFDTLQGAKIVNQARQPLLLVGPHLIEHLMSLGYVLDSQVRLQWKKGDLNPQEIPKNFSEVFRFDAPFDSARYEAIQQQQEYKVNPVYKGRQRWLWKLDKK